MADFRTHVTTSSVLGIGYAGMGLTMGLSIETSLIGGGLCGVSGMLPDLDSDTGIPIREATGFAAGIVPMLLVERLQSFVISYDSMVLIAACLYFLIRFAGASLLGRFTVHRGMFHSIPAALIFAGLAFLICGPHDDYHIRFFKAGAVFFGFMSHLFLDELYSIEWKGGSWRLKRSFGTAIKLWGKNSWANFSTYAKLAIVGVMVAGEPSVMHYLQQRYPQFATKFQRLHDVQEELASTVRDRVSSELAPASENAHWPVGNVASQPNPLSQQLPNANPIAPFTSPSSAFPSQPPSEGGFAPNSGQPSHGVANPMYRADNGFAPR